jgi:hypothetical protein
MPVSVTVTVAGLPLFSVATWTVTRPPGSVNLAAFCSRLLMTFDPDWFVWEQQLQGKPRRFQDRAVILGGVPDQAGQVHRLAAQPDLPPGNA